MLSTDLMSFQNKIKSAMQSAGEKAAKEAFSTTCQKSGQATVDDILNKKMKDTAEKFGKKFGQVFADEVSADLAKAIMNYIKSAEIMITCQPTALASVISPMGPCTGTLVISKATANVQIL